MKEWIKLDIGLFENSKIQAIMAEYPEHCCELIAIWVRILCEAGKSKAKGKLVIDNNPCRVSYIASKLNLDGDTALTLMQAMQKYNLISVVDGFITVNDWATHQTIDDIEKKRQQNNERQKSFRERQKVEKAFNADNVTINFDDWFNKTRDVFPCGAKDNMARKVYKAQFQDLSKEEIITMRDKIYIKIRAYVKAREKDNSLAWDSFSEVIKNVANS